MNNQTVMQEIIDEGHNKNHIEFVFKRALELSKNYDINYNILYHQF